MGAVGAAGERREEKVGKAGKLEPTTSTAAASAVGAVGVETLLALTYGACVDARGRLPVGMWNTSGAIVYARGGGSRGVPTGRKSVREWAGAGIG